MIVQNLIVVALGGNALTPKKGKGTYAELVKNIEKTAKALVPLLKKGKKLILVSGSGPQIGAILLQNELAKNDVPPMPLDILDAELQGELGYLLEQKLQNIFAKEGVKRSVISVVTQVIVDKNDPALKNPTKPIGKFYAKTQAEKMKKRGMIMREQKAGGYRRVVPSPMPKKIDDIHLIKTLVQEKAVVVAAGGGGIPVIKTKNGLKGVRGVIDKDFAAARLALDIGAQELIILTSVPYVYSDYLGEKQQAHKMLSLQEARQLEKEGQFAEGSMLPKIKAAQLFLKKGGKKVVITQIQDLQLALKKKKGTIITT